MPKTPPPDDDHEDGKRRSGRHELVAAQHLIATAEPPKLSAVDLSPELDPKVYKQAKDAVSLSLLRARLDLLAHQVPVVLVFEGWDASGKGGTIHRLIDKFDPRSYNVHSIAAPSQEELDHHYLWRFWNKLPARGRIAVFDRSWYGRVLVERVEGYAKGEEWKRAFDEINQFEQLLVADGTLVIKFFMHISKHEQKRRFEARADNPLKSWKLNDEDYRNRARWDDYVEAIDDMFARTHTAYAPWFVIPANDKRYARMTVQQICIERFKAGTKGAKKH
jgi:PPK2 family polyphosphate:nucleotide phosphotransferase